MVSLSNHVAKVYPVEFPKRNPIQQGERPYPGRSVRRGGLYCYGSRTEGHLERGGIATEPYGDKAAHHVVTHDVIRQKLAEATVAHGPG